MKLLQTKAQLLVPVLCIFFISGIAVGYFSAKPEAAPDILAEIPATQSYRPEQKSPLAETDLPKNIKSNVGPHQKRLATIRDAQAMDVSELIGQIKKMHREISPAQLMTSFLSIYIDSLAALDPVAGAVVYESEPGLRRWTHFFYLSWVNQDPSTAIAYYLANPGLERLGQTILQSEAFESFFLQAEVLATFGSKADRLFNRARVHRLPPDEALELVLGDKVLQMDYSLIASIASRFSQTVDLGYGLERVQQIPLSSARNAFYRSLLREQVNQRSEESFDIINMMFGPDHKDRHLVLQAFLGGGKQNSQLVVQYASDRSDYHLLTMGLSRLANFDLEAAMVTFAEVPKPIDDRNAIARLARQVGNGGPEEAYDWIKQISQRQPTMRDAVLRSLSSNAPDFIEQKLSEETDTDLIASMVENLVQLKATAEPVAAMALLQRYGHPDSYTNAMRNLGYQWGTSNPQEMLDYVIDNPGAQGLVNSVNVATGSWYGKKPDEVLQWLDTVTRQAVRDQGFEGIALVMSTSDPVAALEFTESMSSLAKRENIRVQIIAGWIAKNTSRMDEILSEVELSDSGQARVRRYIDGL